MTPISWFRGKSTPLSLVLICVHKSPAQMQKFNFAMKFHSSKDTAP